MTRHASSVTAERMLLTDPHRTSPRVPFCSGAPKPRLPGRSVLPAYLCSARMIPTAFLIRRSFTSICAENDEHFTCTDARNRVHDVLLRQEQLLRTRGHPEYCKSDEGSLERLMDASWKQTPQASKSAESGAVAESYTGDRPDPAASQRSLDNDG